MADSKKAKGLLDLLNDCSDQYNTPIYEQTLNYLLKQGFEEIDFTNFENKKDKLYVLEDPNGVDYLGKSYAFLLRSDIKDYKFARNFKEERECIAYGLIEAEEIKDYEKSNKAAKMQEEFNKLIYEVGEVNIYFGLDAVRALAKTIDGRNDVLKARKEGLYEVAEHYSGCLDLSDSDD